MGIQFASKNNSEVDLMSIGYDINMHSYTFKALVKKEKQSFQEDQNAPFIASDLFNFIPNSQK